MPEIVSYKNIKPFVRLQDPKLSEGISVFNNRLLWVDIFRSEIYLLNKPLDEVPQDTLSEAEKHELRTFPINHTTYDGEYPFDHTKYSEVVGVVYPYDQQNQYILFGSKFGIGKLELKTGKWTYLVTFDRCDTLTKERFMRLRSNDGGISKDGNYLYIGLMDTFNEDLTDEGCILEYEFKTDKLTMLFNRYKVKIPNSIHYDKTDSNILYITDSLNFKIWKYNKQTDERTELINVQKVNSEFESPEPDGSLIDYEDNLFVTAVWSTNKVQIFDLITGTLQRELLLPVPRISCCCRYKHDLFITTANMNIDNDKTHDNEDTVGGSIYRIPNVFKSTTTASTKIYPSL
ncbi:hypothetical protein TPHA_0M01020 [Tetrapisispora phaffii CBS 4417]|uniref:SMP-30/Gluconolactonase/LRE-like region domain-containing protein n=1 Tax=Tetrapisispora phaffii (strain ATCC 24235 / CBS 4417 / NBRC 1672 / NRRL Y-8282 / UCD 70-5) TaxID=1071381 RepID=G8C0G1_TETPH|nr:hypothetical protein TPHA_0M01020 [Tetrapisispora phaffii CBS 4417]CCE65676.1 hypothetical protein TPHA_0M01020 [Tetrapisispora phaffii CBS 4417]